MKEKSIYAFLLESEGQETILGMRHKNDWFPLVCSSESQMREMRKVALGTKLLEGQKIKLVKFSKRLDIETIEKK